MLDKCIHGLCTWNTCAWMLHVNVYRLIEKLTCSPCSLWLWSVCVDVCGESVSSEVDERVVSALLHHLYLCDTTQNRHTSTNTLPGIICFWILFKSIYCCGPKGRTMRRFRCDDVDALCDDVDALCDGVDATILSMSMHYVTVSMQQCIPTDLRACANMCFCTVFCGSIKLPSWIKFYRECLTAHDHNILAGIKPWSD